MAFRRGPTSTPFLQSLRADASITAVTVVGVPDSEYDAKLEEAEKKKVAAIAASLDETEKDRIVTEAVAFARRRIRRKARPFCRRCRRRPCLARSSVGIRSRATSGSVRKPLQIDAQPTNGITYVNVLFDLTHLPDRLTPYVDLFADYVRSWARRRALQSLRSTRS